MGNKNIEKIFYRESDYESSRQAKKMRKKAKSKKKIIAVVAIVLAALTAGTTLVLTLFKKNKNNTVKKEGEKQNTVQTTDEPLPSMDPVSLDSLGIELEQPNQESKNNEYSNPSPNVDVQKIVEDTDGTVWKNEEASSNSNQIGKEVFNDKNGSLDIKPDGKVYEKDTGYEIKDESGNIETGNISENGSVGDYVWDSDRGEMVHKSELGKYVYSDLDFYFEDGTLAIGKGELISKETYNRARQELLTTKPSNPIHDTTVEIEYDTVESYEPNEDKKIETGITNEDGTYTINGIVFMDKTTYESFIISENPLDDFGYLEGVLYPQSYLDEMNNQKVLVK